jgi:hypothetical protein
MTGSSKIVAYDLVALLADYPGMAKRSAAASPQSPVNSKAAHPTPTGQTFPVGHPDVTFLTETGTCRGAFFICSSAILASER